jgi:hypothetical protein
MIVPETTRYVIERFSHTAKIWHACKEDMLTLFDEVSSLEFGLYYH